MMIIILIEGHKMLNGEHRKETRKCEGKLLILSEGLQ
jgi:hypothetical protein